MTQLWKEDKSKLNATELAKLEMDGLEIVNDLDRLVAQGFAALTPADYDRLKWLGVYAHRPKGEGYFLLRVKIPGGKMTAAQAETIAAIAETHSRRTIDLTTRQCIEYHWLTLEDLPTVLRKLTQAGLSTLEAAGDCPRNIIANPLAGIDAEEFIDTTQLEEELDSFFHNNRDFSNLPRKFKIAISGGVHNSVNAEINDLAFVPAVKEVDGELLKGFEVLVGGGLSHQPRLATRLSVFVLPEEVAKVAGAVAAIFRDNGYREKRNHARIKYLVADWGREKFTEELLRLTGPLLTGGMAVGSSWNAGRALGLHRQKQPGLYYLGLSVPGGRLSPEELTGIANMARTYGDGALRTTNSQDIIIPNISEERIGQLHEETIFKVQMELQESAVSRIVACPGKEFCPFALAETKGRISEISSAIDRITGPETSIRIHMSGCGNSCGQTQIADIGLQGTVIPAEGQPKEGFDIWVGGRLGQTRRLAAKAVGRVPAQEVKEIITAIVKDYLENRLSTETFGEYADRKGSFNLVL